MRQAINQFVLVNLFIILDVIKPSALDVLIKHNLILIKTYLHSTDRFLLIKEKL